MKVPHGYSFYGQRLGVLVFSSQSPRIPGDAGHAATFPYPVCYEIVEGGFSDLVEGSAAVLQSLGEAVCRLRDRGISAIIGDCGLMALYQKEMSKSAGMPVAASSLCQIPLVWTLTGQRGSIGILTGHSALLGDEHLRASGWTPEIPLAIQGMENQPHFKEIVIDGGQALDPAAMERDVLDACGQLTAKHSDLTAIIVECSNLATYSAAVQAQTGLPVFDLVGVANLLAYSTQPPRYPL